MLNEIELLVHFCNLLLREKSYWKFVKLLELIVHPVIFFFFFQCNFEVNYNEEMLHLRPCLLVHTYQPIIKSTQLYLVTTYNENRSRGLFPEKSYFQKPLVKTWKMNLVSREKSFSETSQRDTTVNWRKDKESKACWNIYVAYKSNFITGWVRMKNDYRYTDRYSFELYKYEGKPIGVWAFHVSRSNQEKFGISVQAKF